MTDTPLSPTRSAKSSKSLPYLFQLMSILTNGSASIQQTIFRWVDPTFRDQGYGAIFEAWGDDLWVAEYAPESTGADESDV